VVAPAITFRRSLIIGFPTHSRTKIADRETNPYSHRLRLTFKSSLLERLIFQGFTAGLARSFGGRPMGLHKYPSRLVVLGCFHSAPRRKEDQTDRYLAALRNPAIQILGHPRGRIYNFRLGLKADWPRVFAVAAKLDKAVEIDAYPDRQDLSIDLVRLPKKSG
jgi:hypothetical protein